MALYNLEAEAKVLNAMCSFNDCLDVGMSGLTKEHFSDNMHRVVFEVIGSMYGKDEAVTMITVAERVSRLIDKRSQQWLFVEKVFSSGSEMKFYIDELNRCLSTRKISKVAKNILDGIKNNDNVKDIIEKAQNDSCAVGDETDEIKVYSPSEFAEMMYERLCTPLDDKSKGMRTGFEKLDEITNGGFHGQELIILSAKTGKGKSASAMNIAKQIALVDKNKTLFINTEMGDEQMVNRWGSVLSNRRGLNYKKCATRTLDNDDLVEIANNVCEKMKKSGFHFATIPDLTISNINMLAKKYKVQTGIKILFIDYIQRLDLQEGMKEWEQLKLIAKRLKNLAQKLDIAIVMLAQINEDGTLQGSRMMKNEVDLFIELREMNDEESLEHGENGIYNYLFDITKNRNGRCGKVKLHFYGEYMRFYGEEKIGEVKKIMQG